MADVRGREERVAAAARRQFGLVTGRQLVDAGLTRPAIQRRVGSGRLRHVCRGVYAVGGSPSSWEQAALAACLSAGAGALLSHRSAAAVWGLDVTPEPCIHVTVPYERRSSRTTRAVVVHRSRALTAVDGTRRRGLPLTTVGRTLVDLAAVLDDAALAQVVDDVLCRRLISPERLAAAVDRLGSGRRPARGLGSTTRRLRCLLEPWQAGAPLESIAESRVRRMIAAAGLPPAVAQHSVPGARARVDFAWPERKVALEVDGFRWHANPQAHARDSARANRLAAHGWTVVRVTPVEIDQGPEHVWATLRRHLAGPPAPDL